MVIGLKSCCKFYLPLHIQLIIILHKHIFILASLKACQCWKRDTWIDCVNKYFKTTRLLMLIGRKVTENRSRWNKLIEKARTLLRVTLTYLPKFQNITVFINVLKAPQKKNCNVESLPSNILYPCAITSHRVVFLN